MKQIDEIKELVNLEEDCGDCKRINNEIKSVINPSANYMVLFPYLRNSTRSVTDKEIICLQEDNVEYLTSLYNEIFGESHKVCDCPQLHNEMREKLLILTSYQKI